MRCHTLFKKDDHIWLVFCSHSENPAELLPLNAHVICAGTSVTLIDPGSIRNFPSYLASFSEQIALERVSRIILTSANVAATCSLSLWLQVLPNNIQVLVPIEACAILRHLNQETDFKTIASNGEDLTLEDGSILTFISTKQLNNAVSLTIYDNYSRTLYSGTIGQNSADISTSDAPFFPDFRKDLPSIMKTHGSLFPNRGAREQWVGLVKKIDLDFIAPLTGACMRRAESVLFLDTFVATLTAKSKETDKPEIIEQEKIKPVGEKIEPRRIMPKDILGKKYRLITRSDFDGLVCAIILEELGLVDDILFVHPNQMQMGEVLVSERDISTNLPYTPGVFAVFDHHISEINRSGALKYNHIIDPAAASAARVVYNFFGGKKVIPNISEEMLAAVDQADSAQYTLEDVISPKKWTLLNFVMDPRTGLGRFHGFRIPNYELMMSLIDLCRDKSIDDVLKQEDVKERIDFYFTQETLFKNQIKRCSQVNNNIVIVDLTNEETIHAGNRFIVYALFPECNASMHVMWGLAKQKTVFSCGKSIFNRTLDCNIGALMLKYGGGGHADVGSCYVENEMAKEVKSALVQKLIEPI